MIWIKAEPTNFGQAIKLGVYEKQGMVYFIGCFVEGADAHEGIPYYFLWRKWLKKDATLQDEISLFKERPEILERLYVSYCLVKHEEAEVYSADPDYLLYRENGREISILHKDSHISITFEAYGGKLGKSVHVEATAFFDALNKLLE